MAEDAKKSLAARLLGPLGSLKFAIGALLVAALLGASFLVLRKAYQDSASYYQRRDLHMLDRVGRDVSNAVDGLRIAAGLHFDPDAMLFTLSPIGRCLVGTVWVPFDRRDRIKIDFNFVDPLRSEAWLARMAAEDDEGLKLPPPATGSSTAPPIARFPGATRCRLERPPGATRPAIATLDRRLSVSLYMRTSQLLGAGMPPRRRTGTAAAAPQRQRTPQEVRADLTRAAIEQLTGEPTNQMPGAMDAGALRRIATDSIDTALRSNLIRITAQRDAPEIGATAAAAHFDAIRLFGAAKPGAARALLWQTGEVPPVLDGSMLEGSDQTALRLLGIAPPPKPAAKGDAPPAGNEGANLAAPAASVTRVANLVIYQRDYIGPDGLGCPKTNPCKLIAVRQARAVDAEARRIDGVSATWLLIGILTVIGCLPLVQLVLSKRLDPIQRVGQYLLWLSLGFLAASATVTALAILANDSSIRAGDRGSDTMAEEIAGRLGKELRATANKVHAIGTKLACWPDQVREPFTDLAPKRPPSPPQSDGMLVDSVLLFDELGLMAARKPTMTLLEAPSYAASVWDRRYFRAAVAGDTIQLPPTEKPAPPAFTIQQLFSKPDGVRKTAIAVPLALPAPCPGTEAPDRIGAPRVAIATGVLQTFLHRSPQPGLAYAVIDRAVTGDPNVLFHSDRSNELVSRFADDVDDADAVARLLTNARTWNEATKNFEPGTALSTRYQARPVRLHAYQLQPGLPWVLVAIEDRDQPGYGIWRDVVAGYAAWILVLGGIALLLLPATLLWSRGLDRQPAMWLWPHRILVLWPLRFAQDRQAQLRLKAARAAYSWRAALTALCVPAVVITPAPARLLMALLAVTIAASARGSFAGELAANPQQSDRDEARRIDLWVIFAGMGFALLVIAADAYLLWNGSRIPGRQACAWLSGMVAIGALLVLVADTCRSTLLGNRLPPLLRRGDDPSRLERAANAPSLKRGTWAILLVAASIAPAAAGFLDSQTSNRYWASNERNAARTDFYYTELQDRRRAINHSLDRRYTIVHDDIGPTLFPTEAEQEQSWFRQGVHWLGLDEKVRQTSRMLPWQWSRPSLPSAGLAILPFLALLGALTLFRRQFFQRADIDSMTSPGLTTANLAGEIDRIAGEAHALAGLPQRWTMRMPFAQSFRQRHLIVGARDCDEWSPILDTAPRVAHIDLLGMKDVAQQLPDPKDVGAVLIHGFNAALLRLETYRLALDRLEGLLAIQEEVRGRHLHLFLFTASEPTDRILATRAMRDDAKPPATQPPAPASGDTATAKAETNAASGDQVHADPPLNPVPRAYRWAALLDTFMLYNVAQQHPMDAPTLFERELKAVGSRAAERLLDSKAYWAAGEDRPEELIAFLTDFLADHYKLIWETSSMDERVILYEIARGSHLKMRDSFALRSLEARHLVVRAPEYRLMNRSFTRYVQQIGTPEDMRAAAAATADGTDKIFPILQWPLALLLGAGLLLLALVTPGEAGFATALPALAAAFPALLSTWLRSGRGASG